MASVGQIGGPIWIRLLMITTVALASGDTYDSIMAIENQSKRRSIGAVVLLAPSAVTFTVIWELAYPYCLWSINGGVVGLYLAKGLASYLYCARAELVLTASMQQISKRNSRILTGMKAFAICTIIFNCSKGMLVYKNILLPNGICIADIGGQLWGASDEILFSILDVATCIMLYSFYVQFEDCADSTSVNGKSNVKRVLGRILRLSVISVLASIFAVIMQFQSLEQIMLAGTFDVCVSVITLTLVFNKPARNSARASMSTRKRTTKLSGTSNSVQPESAESSRGA